MSRPNRCPVCHRKITPGARCHGNRGLVALLVAPLLTGCALFTSASSEVRASAQALELDLATYAAISTAAPGIPGDRHLELGRQLQRHVAALGRAVE